MGAILIAREGGGCEYFADEEGACVDVGGIEQAGGGDAATERCQLVEGVAIEAQAGVPGAEPPEEQGAERGCGDALGHVGPYAPALPGQQQAERHSH